MQTAYIGLVAFLMIYSLIYYSSVKPALAGEAKAKSQRGVFVILMTLALLVRIGIAVSVEGFSSDINCFKAWAEMAYEGGLSNFYLSETFADYPPGYVYVLYVIGFLKNLFKLDYNSPVFLFLIKLPAIICDMLSGIFIYNLASEKKELKGVAASLAAIYLLNPAIIINSSAWGQVDSVYTLFVIGFIYLLIRDKYILSCIVFSLGFLIKPQGVIFAPVLICYFIYRAFFKKDVKNLLKETLIAFVSCAALVFLLILPFSKNFNFYPVINQYIDTLKSYPYASVNAYNLFMLFGGNWLSITKPFLFLTFSVWSTIFIVLTVVFAVFVFIKSKGEKSFFEIGAFVIMAVFTLAGKMHERYAFPVMLLLIMAFIMKKDKRYLFMYVMISVTHFINVFCVLYLYTALNSTALPKGFLPYLVAFLNIAILIYMANFLLSPKKEEKKEKSFSFIKSEKGEKLKKTDFIIMAVVTLVYSVVAFSNLGDMKAPETHCFIPGGTSVKVKLEEPAAKMRWFSGYTEERNFDITGKETDEESSGSVFTWHEHNFYEKQEETELYFYEDTDIIELAFFNEKGEYIKTHITADDVEVKSLTDEKHLVKTEDSYKNSMYFDEIYHGRTAYEYIHSLDPYENTHPPLGKLIISLGIMIFGMTPFGWRFSGTLFGVLMLPCIYIFSKKMFKSTKIATFSMLLMTFDFMHFTQTRIATIDVFVTLFIILMFYFMYSYQKLSFYDTPLLKTFIPLGLSGLFFGLAVASKWTGIYGGAGLFVIFLLSVGRRIYEYNKITNGKGFSKEEKEKVSCLKKNLSLTVLFCIGAFVILPVLIYILSYIPYLKAPGMDGIKSIIENQAYMFDYHANLDATHPYSSEWYTWPINIKPVWYYTSEAKDGIRQTIASFGNPVIWWLGLIALVWVFIRAVKNRGEKEMFLSVSFLAQFLPWVGVARCVFLYHYFPSVPFIILALSHFYYKKRDENLWDTLFLIVLCICLILFVMYYPVLSGFGAYEGYIDALKILPEWHF